MRASRFFSLIAVGASHFAPCVLATAVLVAGIPSTGQGQTADHLQCYRFIDPLIVKGSEPPGPRAFLELTNEEFGSEDCKIVGAIRFFCVPVSKTLRGGVRGKPRGAEARPVPFIPDVVTGITEQEKICYKIKCKEQLPSPPNPSQSITDQFGNRIVTDLEPFMLCGPARKADEGPPMAPVLLDR